MRRRRQLTLVSLLICSLPFRGWSQQQSGQTAAQLASKLDSEISGLTSSNPPATTPDTAANILQALGQLQEQSIMVFGARKQQLDDRTRQLQEAIEQWQSATNTDATRNPQALDRMHKLWAEMKRLYPREALQILPPLWSCPMHQNLFEKSAGNCPVCGMPLEPIYLTQPQLTQTSIIRAEMITKTPLEIGKRADLRIRLSFVSDGKPVLLSDLEETHTRKIHLLITDISETDYHHEHPVAVSDGEYAFSFIPHRPDTYRVWADLMPVRSRIQQYSVADIASTTPRQGRLAQDEPESRHAEIDGYKFDLSFAKQLIHERETVSGKLRVTNPDGRPCENLQVVMGAFGHLVGFCDDFATVLHLHPVGALIDNPQALGGPELLFYFRSNKTGTVRLFSQVKINDKDFFPRFIVRLQPLQHLPDR
jgi:Heavy metal binding domain